MIYDLRFDLVDDGNEVAEGDKCSGSQHEDQGSVFLWEECGIEYLTRAKQFAYSAKQGEGNGGQW